MTEQIDTQYATYLESAMAASHHSTGDFSQAMYQRWIMLTNRLADELKNGFTMLRISNETGLEQILINEWAADFTKFRFKDITYRALRTASIQPAEKVELALEKMFKSIDLERSVKPFEPEYIETSVSKRIIDHAIKIRYTSQLGEVETPPGSGKTYTMRQFIADCRKNEGFDCPVWSITLSQTNNNLKHVLYEIALAMSSSTNQSLYGNRLPELKDEYAMSKYIERRAHEKPNGLLFIDEAQNICDHLSGATNKHSIISTEELRKFTDSKLFGIVLLGNGEVFRSAKRAGSVQLVRRMEAWKINVGKPTPNDVDLIMNAWKVSGKEERDWSIKIGCGEGGLGALTDFYRASLVGYGKISIATLRAVRKD